MTDLKPQRRWRSASLCASMAAASILGWAAIHGPAGTESISSLSVNGALAEPGVIAGQAPSVSAAVHSAAQSDNAAYEALSEHLRNDPLDHRAWAIKARLDVRAERFGAAAAAYRAALAGRSKVALDPDVWVEFAEALALSRGGDLAGEPLQHLDKALSIRPTHPGALDLAAAAAWDSGNFDRAAMYWKRLLLQLSTHDPQRAAVQAALERAQRKALFALPRRE